MHVTAIRSIAAFLVVGERGHREVTIDASAAQDHAARHHGLVVDLVRADEVGELLRAAYDAGREAGRREAGT